MSTFFSDGYHDARHYRPASPPDPFTTSKGTTNVFAAEYMDGYRAGLVDRDPEEASGIDCDTGRRADLVQPFNHNLIR